LTDIILHSILSALMLGTPYGLSGVNGGTKHCTLDAGIGTTGI